MEELNLVAVEKFHFGNLDVRLKLFFGIFRESETKRKP